MRPHLQPDPAPHDPSGDWELAQLPEALEADFFEALSGGAISPELAAYADGHPDVAAELADARDLAAMLRDDARQVEPGADFFEALHDDILGQLGAQQADAAPEATEAVAPVQPQAPTWLDRVRALWQNNRPVFAALAVASVAALCAWALLGDADDPTAPSGLGAAPPEVASYDPASHLPEGEREALRDLARDMEITLDVDAQAADYDGESFAVYDDALVGGSFEPDLNDDGDALSDEAFDAAFAELEGSL